MPVDFGADFIDVVTAEHGWILLTALIAWQLFCPLPNHETKFQKLMNSIQKEVDELKQQQTATIDNLEKIAETQNHLTQVVRAIARENDGIDDERTDRYLIDNGVVVSDFQVNPKPEHLERDNKGVGDGDTNSEEIEV